MTARIQFSRLEDAFEATAARRAEDARELAKRFTGGAETERRLRATMDACDRSFIANTRIHDQRDEETHQRHLREAMDATRFFPKEAM